MVLLLGLTVAYEDIAWDYMFISTNYTNNGGIDNSTCDIKIDGLYWDPLTGANYAGFAFIETSVPNAMSLGYSAGDSGFGCNVDFDGSTTSWKCFEITALNSSWPGYLAFGSSIAVSNVYQDPLYTYISATLNLKLNQFPQICNSSLRTEQKVWLQLVSVSNAAATITQAAFDNWNDWMSDITSPMGDNPMIAMFDAPECKQGIYNNLQSSSISMNLNALFALLVFY